jgi:hypothetical protein
VHYLFHFDFKRSYTNSVFTLQYLQEVEAHLDEATHLPIVLREYITLQNRLTDVKAWLQAAASLMPGFGVKGSCTEQQLKQLILDAQV